MLRYVNFQPASVISGSAGQGFVDYNDALTATMPIALVADTWTTLTNDILGVFTNTSFIPSGVTSMLDPLTGQLDFSELSLGDVVLIRKDFTVTPSTNNQLLQTRYILGTGAGEYTLEKLVGKMDTGGGTPVRQSSEVDMIYMGDSNTRDNPVTIQIKTSGIGTVVNAGVAMTVIKR